MSILVPSPRAVRSWRLLPLLLVSLVCLSGASCNDSPPQSDTALVGTDTTTPPPPSAQDTLVSLINSRVRVGLPAVTSDPAGVSVAQAHSDYMLSTGILTEIKNGEDFATRLIAAGVTPPVSPANVIAYGFSDPNALVDAILADASLTNDLKGNFTRIGVGLAGQGNGNYWTILLY